MTVEGEGTGNGGLVTGRGMGMRWGRKEEEGGEREQELERGEDRAVNNFSKLFSLFNSVSQILHISS
jgi:hypothetical protein